MAEGKKSTRTRSLPLVSCFHPLHKLQLKAALGLSAGGTSRVQFPRGFPGDAAVVIPITGARHAPASLSLTLAKQNSISRGSDHEGWFLLLFLTPFSAKHNAFCCAGTSICVLNELDLVADPSGLLKQALPSKTCISVYTHWHNLDFRSSV